MRLFLQELIKTLDYEDKYWRSNTVLMWDNAGYHSSVGVLTLLQEQRAPVLFLGPYSYHMAPTEMVFAALKIQLLNPENAPLGKK
jgi:transposase